ncbi:MAG: hypothetical protein JNK32_06285 [Anaerolineales bacterium]|nr:hypothetical protein [Anaerolineales bacterium]
MKRLSSFFFLLSLLLSACAPASQTPEEQQAIEPVATAEESQAAPQSATASEEPPLPLEPNAALIDTPAIINIEMLDEVNGWAVTEENIIRTNDGGVTWYDVTPGNFADAGYLIYPEFFSARWAWVQFPDMNNYPNGGTLYRTSDGGTTWESFVTPFSGGIFHFIDEENGWMMADLGVGAGSMAVSIFQTSDGGETWNRVYTNDPNIEGAGESLPLGGIKGTLLPLDAQTMWVGGVVYAPGTVYLFRSEDGGETWTQIKLSLPTDAAESELSVEDIRFVSSTHGVIKLRITSDTPQVVLYATEDGGNTWSRLPTIFEGAGYLDIPSASEMIFYTGDQFHVTTDAGLTFTTITPDVKFGDSVIDISFANSTTGWVVTFNESNKRILYKTTDGGVSWTALTQ